MSSMDIQFIVQNLKSLLNFDLSLVSFSEKTSEQLIRLLVRTFSELSDIFAKQVRGQDDNLNSLVDRVAQFLRSVKYQPSCDHQTFLEGLANGDTDVVYPVFKWILHPSQRGTLGERAFVGYYLSDIQLPEDLLNDYDCLEIRQQIKVLQSEFVEKHKMVSEKRKSGQDPSTVKKAIAKLEQEKELLHKKIDKTTTKVKSKVHRERLDELREVCSALRRQQDEETYLKSAMEQQHFQFQVAEEKYNAAVTRLQEIKQSLSSSEISSPESLLSQLQEETKHNREAVNDRLPRETEQKHKHLSVLQYVLQEANKGQGWTEARLSELQRSNQDKKQEIEALQARQADSMSKSAGDLQLVQQRQMANMISRKKQDLEKTVDDLMRKKERLGLEYEEQLSLAEIQQQQDSCSEEEMNQVKGEVKALTKKYQSLKSSFTELNAEQLVLERTQGILQQMEGSTGRDPGSELSKTAKRIGEVSVAKTEVDEMKSAQLEKISGLVQDINSSIKERKAKLAPQIKELRTLRAKYKEVEEVYASRKKENQANLNNFEARIGKLASEERQLRTSVGQNETLYHLLNCSSSLLATNQRRATNPTVADRVLRKYEDKLQQQAGLLREYSAKAGSLKENHGASVDQASAMQGLLKILNMKLDSLSRGNVGGEDFQPVANYETASSNVLQF
ncbi:intraflagellar transport protein 81 [Chloropicon primus]|uniref:Intraflagellar transport protein 81 n=1 Tax=Chloropicon primus TaxID=1764295 RepID=A0A5B8MJD7_9CHLO|nr:intraflagellar transport protein 81 [Chloropicon primus]UPQ98672.1 intraflagellar transport protein 81 [Chloropicon primus]|eukprot:QDZ19462.1 intraflagellar transport protein 81 [Chloropicon primus]